MTDTTLTSNENDELIDRVCRGVASNQEGQQLREYIADLQKRVDFAADALTVVERRRDQLKAERDALRGSHETLSGVSFEEHERYKRCLYRANGRLIQLGHEPEKLDYPSQKASEHPGPNCSCHECAGVARNGDPL